MVEIEKAWFGDKTKCQDSDSLNSPQSLGLASFLELFVLLLVAGVGILIFCVFKFLHKHWGVISFCESMMWDKMKNLLEKVGEADLRSDRNDGCCADRARRAMLFRYVWVISIGRVLERSSTENATTYQQGELTRNRSQVIELVDDANENNQRQCRHLLFTEVGRLLFTSNTGL